MIEMGNFVKNNPFGYITYIIGNYYNSKIMKLYGGIIVQDVAEQGFLSHRIEGTFRMEVESELILVKPTLELIEKARTYIDKFNTPGKLMIDNLTYIELLNKLNEQEKDLKNEL